MGRRTIAFWGTGLLFGGGICTALIVITTTLGWLGFGAKTAPRLTRITLLSPLAITTATPLKSVNPTLLVKPNPTVAPSTAQPLRLPATVTTPPPPVPENTFPSHPPTEPVARLVIPKLKLDTPVILSPMLADSWQVDHLGQTVGYLEGTALPGSDSNLVLAAHVTLATGVDGPFSQLNQLSATDVLWVHYQGQVFQYMVDDTQEVDPTTMAVTYPSPQGQITLITCSQWDKTQGRYLDRLVVKGHLVGG